MRVSQQLTTTLRASPRDTEGGNADLLVRAGYMRQLVSGLYSYLPLGQRVLQKIAQIVREEINIIGGQEVAMPIIQPQELWAVPPADNGPARIAAYGPVLFKLKDRRERAMVLAPTAEEVATLLAKEFVRSYRDLPQLLYQISVKLRDEPRPRGGLLRTREFLMMDLYSFDADQEGLDSSYNRMRVAFDALFTRCGLKFLAVEADSGAIGGKDSHEYIAPTLAGEDDIMQCERCGYAANREKAVFVRSELAGEAEGALEEVYTPNCMSIADLAAFLKIPEAKTLKALCYIADGRLILVAIRGDLEVNEVKLTNALYRAGVPASDLRLATPEEMQQAGIVAGFTSPLNKGADILILADPSLKQGGNFVAGANKVDYHIKNVNYPRDFRVDIWEDIALAYDGAVCARCGGTLHSIRGCELGHVFKLGTRYSVPFAATYLDAEGETRPMLMGCYGIGLNRLMGVIVEQNHDEKGLIWPLSVAPYAVALLGLDLDKDETLLAAEQLYAHLLSAGIEVLYDDRSESAGVKFNDADLLGLPLRAVVSKRSLKNGGVELKWRAQKESRIVPLPDAVQIIKDELRMARIP